ncbi:MAG: efflux RND transporter periplasmic adaptor subunit [Myxococcota bacterium]
MQRMRVVSVTVLAASVVGALLLVATKKEPPRGENPPEGTLVEVIEVDPEGHDVTLHAKGMVVPSQQVLLQAEVGGRVVWQSSELVPGGRFHRGQPVLRIDPRDYDLAVEAFRAEVNRARLELRLETRRAEVAKREWSSFGDRAASDDQRALAQREPQLQAARLALKAAQSALEGAQLDRSRTVLRAPFNAMVVSEDVDPGRLISPQTSVARLVNTDEFYVQASVPVGSLRTITTRTASEHGSPVSVTQQAGEETIQRRGEVIRKLADLDPDGSMARVLVRIDDPLGDGNELPLLLGSYVDVVVEAKPIEMAIRVPRAAVHGGRNVYVMNEDDLLEIREVDVAWALPEALLISNGLRAGDRIVTSRITNPVPNTKLRLAARTGHAQSTDPTTPSSRAMP